MKSDPMSLDYLNQPVDIDVNRQGIDVKSKRAHRSKISTWTFPHLTAPNEIGHRREENHCNIALLTITYKWA